MRRIYYSHCRVPYHEQTFFPFLSLPFLSCLYAPFSHYICVSLYLCLDFSILISCLSSSHFLLSIISPFFINLCSCKVSDINRSKEKVKKILKMGRTIALIGTAFFEENFVCVYTCLSLIS